MSRRTLLFLGMPRIERGGVPVEVDTRKAVALAAYLAVTRQRQSRDALAALLWPEYEGARAALRRTLSALNRALGEGFLEADRGSVGLSREADLWVDVERFQRLLAEVRTHGHPETEACPACRQPLTEAVRLYRDDFLAGFSLRDSAAFDDWQFFQAEGLRRDLAGALERLMRLLCARGEFESAVAYGRRRLALDPLHEPAHRALMELYAWAGERAAAVRQYRECVRILDQELGVAPLAATTQLYQAIQENRTPPPPTEPSTQSIPAQTRGKPPALAQEVPAAPLDYPLVGRATEWQALVGAYSAVGAHGGALVLEGEAGIGKTRLAEEFLAHVRGMGATTLSARCYEGESDLAYAPLVEPLRAAVDHVSRGGVLDNIPAHALSEAARLLPELNGRLPGLPPASPLDSPGAKARFFEGVTEVLRATSRDERPAVLFVDDAHWADAAFLDLLIYLLRRLRGRPLCVLLAWRSVQVPASHRLRGALADAQRAGTASILSLSRLSRSAVEELVRKVAPSPATPLVASASGSAGPEALARHLHEETEGLPLLISEYLTAITTGTVRLDDAGWQLPGGARDVLRSRLDAVDEAGRQVLSAAAVIGRSFDFDTVQAASGRDEETTVTALEELIARGIVSEVRGAGDQGPAYDFGHEKLRTLVYEELSLARRRLLHRRVAEALAARARARRDTGALPGKIAHHYQQAGQEPDAATYYKLAGEHARSLYANVEALAHFRAALALGHPERAVLNEAIGDLHTLMGEYGAALTSYETAAALCAPAALAEIERKLGGIHQRRGAWELAESSFRAAAALGEDGPAAEQARLYADWSLVAHHQRRVDQAIAFAHRALRLAEDAEDRRALAQAHNVLGIIASGQGELDRARDHLERSEALAGTLGDPGVRAAALNNLALVCGAAGEGERALELAETALALCASQGDRHREAALHNNLADLLHAAGRTESALSHIKQAVAIYAEIGVEAGAVQPEIWKLAEW